MSRKEQKAALKELLKGFITKGAIALAKLIKSKLLPEAEEKYCKVLQGVTEKLTSKAVDRITDLANEKNPKKRICDLYLLKLIKETLDAVAISLTETANYINENVDFKELEEPTEEALVALAEIPGALDNDEDGCGPDGCEIV